jgi:hypothetical protein
VNRWVEQRRPALLAARHQPARQPGVHTGFLRPVQDTRPRSSTPKKSKSFLTGHRKFSTIVELGTCFGTSQPR